ncbi:hypothetical protein [Paenibacillus sp. 1A_MP2]|uniref:hypothetical protein n=1 Tax=Paenibacillus sp. 1A_MP2 TaxID=3457495 RepID=UPI003FCE6FFE
MIPLRCIIVQGICELKQGRTERTGSRRFFLMESIFFPLGMPATRQAMSKKFSLTPEPIQKRKDERQ